MILYSFFMIPSFLATAFVIVLVSLKRDEYVPYVALTGSLMAMAFSFLSIPQVLSKSPITIQMEEWVAPFGITIYGDVFSVFLTAILSFVAFMIVLFSFRFIRERRTKYYALLSLLFGGVFGVIHTGDIFNLFVFMELLSIASYGLIAFYKDRLSLEASIKYLIMGSLGTSLLLVGIAFLYGLTGTLNMADMAPRLAGMSNPAVAVAFGLILAGLGIKAGFIPFHTLHLDGYTAAPSTVSAVLAAVVTNVGLYAILRITFILFQGPFAALQILLWLGTLSMVLGAVLALRQDNLKRLLAYSGVSQIGFIAMSVGLGTSLGLLGGIFHMVNQALIKGLLFLCAGAVIYLTGTGNLSELSGKIGNDRLLSYSFLAGVLALAGVPLFNGFASKWIIYIASLEVNPLFTVLAVVSSALTLAYGLKAHSAIFSGNPIPTGAQAGTSTHRGTSTPGRRASGAQIPLSMKIPILILAALIILLGVLPWTGLWIASSMTAGLDSAAYIRGVPI